MSRIPVLETRGFVDDKIGILDITIHSVTTNIVDKKESISWYYEFGDNWVGIPVSFNVIRTQTFSQGVKTFQTFS